VAVGPVVGAVVGFTAADFLAVVAHVRTAVVRLVVERIAAVEHLEVADRIAPQRRAPLVLRDQAVIPCGREPAQVPIDPEARLALRKSLATVSGIPLERRTLSVRV